MGGSLNKKGDKNKSVIQEFILNSNNGSKGPKQPQNNSILAFIPPAHNMSVNMQQNLASKQNSLFSDDQDIRNYLGRQQLVVPMHNQSL